MLLRVKPSDLLSVREYAQANPTARFRGLPVRSPDGRDFTLAEFSIVGVSAPRRVELVLSPRSGGPVTRMLGYEEFMQTWRVRGA